MDVTRRMWYKGKVVRTLRVFLTNGERDELQKLGWKEQTWRYGGKTDGRKQRSQRLRGSW